MRENGKEVGERGEDNEGADEGGEGGRGAKVYAAHNGAEGGAEDNSAEGVVLLLTDTGKEAGKRRSVVAGESPEDAGGGDIATDTGDESRNKGKDKESDSAGAGSGCLTIDLG